MSSQQLSLLTGDAVPAALGGPRRRGMTVSRLMRWADRQIPWIAEKSHADRNSALFLYIQAVKLGEEVGELNAELLASEKVQRADKCSAHSDKSLAAEFADVLLCLAILAQAAGVDLDAAVEAKIVCIAQRREFPPDC